MNIVCHKKNRNEISRGESAEIGWTYKVKQVINLHDGNKFKQPVSYVVLNSICNIKFSLGLSVHCIVSKMFEINNCPALNVRRV